MESATETWERFDEIEVSFGIFFGEVGGVETTTENRRCFDGIGGPVFVFVFLYPLDVAVMIAVSKILNSER